MFKKHIPNTITCLNLISGCIATYWAFQGDYRMALLFIVIGAVFDFFDGMVAPLARNLIHWPTTSPSALRPPPSSSATSLNSPFSILN